MTATDFSKIMLESLGYRVTGLTDSRQTFEAFKSNPDDFDLIITDMTMPHMTGEELTGKILAIRPNMPVIICTGYSEFLSPDQARKIGIREYIEKPILKRDLATKIRKIFMAFDSGAWDYILKPFSKSEIKLQVQRSLELRESKRALKISTENILDRSGIIGSSPRLISRLSMVAQSAKSDANVLITGQTGTGKELFARSIHANSLQRENLFVVVDCAALPEQLVESVLFGHVKGAFTGADSNQEGLVKKADGGTLFLDEIGELPKSTQKKFLRVLQERKFKPVGGTKEIASHFRPGFSHQQKS